MGAGREGCSGPGPRNRAPSSSCRRILLEAVGGRCGASVPLPCRGGGVGHDARTGSGGACPSAAAGGMGPQGALGQAKRTFL